MTRTFEGVTPFHACKKNFLCFRSLLHYFLTAAALLVCGEFIQFLLLRRPYVRTRGSTHFCYVFEKYYQLPPRAIDEGMGSKKRANKEEEEEEEDKKEKRRRRKKKVCQTLTTYSEKS